MRGQSEFPAFIIVIIIILVLVLPLLYILSNYSVPSEKNLDYVSIVDNQINGGSVLIFFKSTPYNSCIEVLRGNGNFTLSAVFYTKDGVWYNITSEVHAVNKQMVGLPEPLIYNFTLPEYVWNYTIVLQIEAYNVTVFAMAYPNESAFT
ncbi:MAG: hypothetical protein MPF33_05780 [Candidatus Aramenus sp.]|jgi:hypothetical protein|nr:hypothetical protein [Candidatus Aramenus sp.]